MYLKSLSVMYMPGHNMFIGLENRKFENFCQADFMISMTAFYLLYYFLCAVPGKVSKDTACFKPEQKIQQVNLYPRMLTI